MNRSISVKSMYAIVIAWLFYFVGIMSKVEFGVIKFDLQQRFNINDATIGLYASLTYYVYAALQIPYGVMIDRVKPKSIIGFCSALCGCGVLLLYFADVFNSVTLIKVARVLVGVSVAPSFLCCCKVSAEFFSQQYSLMMALSTGVGCCGGFVATVCTEHLVKVFGWQHVTCGIAFVCFLVCLFAVIFMQDNSAILDVDKLSQSGREMDEGCNRIKRIDSILSDVRAVACSYRMWLVGYYGLAGYIVISALAELWIMPFVSLRYSNVQDVAVASGVIMVGFGIGGIVSEIVSRMLDSYKRAMNIMSMMMVCLFAVVVYVCGISYTIFLLLLFVVSICAGSNTLAFSIGYKLSSPEQAGISGSFINTIVSLSGVLQMLLGRTLTNIRGDSITYTVDMYQKAFLIIIVFMVVAFIISLAIPNIKPSDQ